MQIQAMSSAGLSDRTPPANTLIVSDRAKLTGSRILLLEDEVMIAIQLRAAMEDEGANVTVVRSPDSGLEAAERQPFDAAVLDVNLGRGRTCEAVAEALDYRRTPFVLHTGDYTAFSDVVERLDAPVIAKPAHPDRLIDELSKLLALQ